MINDKLKEFIHKYLDELNTDIVEFLDCAENELDIDDYAILINMLEDSNIELLPEEIFKDYSECELLRNNPHIRYFMSQKFDVDEINDFNGWSIKNIEGKSAALRHQDIYIINNRVGDSEVAGADLVIRFEDDLFHSDERIHNNIQIRFFSKNGTTLKTFIYFTADIEEEMYNLFKVVPNYGIGWNINQLNEIKQTFVGTLKDCLEIN